MDLNSIPREAGGRVQPVEAPAPGEPSPLPRLIRDVKLDLSRRLGLDISAIALVNSQRVTWRDTSLGCPTPGEHYERTPTPGYRLVLRARNSLYRYHTREAAAFILCTPAAPGGNR